MHDFLGSRLPNELYLYLVHGLIGPSFLNCIMFGQLLEYPPLCNGESKEYRLFLIKLATIRSRAFGLVADQLCESIRDRGVMLVTWYDPETDLMLRGAGINVSYGSDWNVSTAFIEEEMQTQNVMPFFSLPSAD